MENNSRKKLLIIPLLLAVFVAAVVIISSNVKEWTCDWCDKTWKGDAYHGSSLDSTLCEDCAWKYWSPFPIDNYKK